MCSSGATCVEYVDCRGYTMLIVLSSFQLSILFYLGALVIPSLASYLCSFVDIVEFVLYMNKHNISNLINNKI